MYKLKATSVMTPLNFLVQGKPHVGLRELKGVLIPGMSGGPVVDEDGTIIGINNVTNFGIWNKAWSRELKDTILCTG